MKLNVVDKKGKSVGEVTLSGDVFDVAPHDEVLKQYIRVYQHNQRQGTVAVKGRGDVSGGGRKPWRQKKTGKARHGSIRSPLWVGGGVSHGPVQKNWRLLLPSRIRALAIKSALSYQFQNKNVVILDKFELKEPKTKALSDLLQNLKIETKALLVTREANKPVVQSAKNMPTLKVSFVGNLNGFEVLQARHLIITKDAAKALEEKYKS